MDLESLKDGSTIAVMGVGNPDRGDDGSGPYIAEKLINDGFKNVFNCLSVPENYLGKVGKLDPDIVLIADAVDMGRPPGFFTLADPNAIHQGITTHNAGLDMIAKFLKMSSEAEIYILAIQPSQKGSGTMSPAVKTAADKIIKKLKEVI
jgi:hydrogenase 3 maturation protease